MLLRQLIRMPYEKSNADSTVGEFSHNIMCGYKSPNGFTPGSETSKEMRTNSFIILLETYAQKCMSYKKNTRKWDR